MQVIAARTRLRQLNELASHILFVAGWRGDCSQPLVCAQDDTDSVEGRQVDGRGPRPGPRVPRRRQAQSHPHIPLPIPLSISLNPDGRGATDSSERIVALFCAGDIGEVEFVPLWAFSCEPPTPGGSDMGSRICFVDSNRIVMVGQVSASQSTQHSTLTRVTLANDIPLVREQGSSRRDDVLSDCHCPAGSEGDADQPLDACDVPVNGDADSSPGQSVILGEGDAMRSDEVGHVCGELGGQMPPRRSGFNRREPGEDATASWRGFRCSLDMLERVFGSMGQRRARGFGQPRA